MNKKALLRPDYFMAIAELTALRGTCNKIQVGCVLVDRKTNRIASVGYNSSAKGTPHCYDVGCLMIDNHCIRTLHAEQAAVLNLRRHYESLICYTTHEPCMNCYKILTSANVKYITFLNNYPDLGQDELVKSIGITPEQFIYTWSFTKKPFMWLEN